MTSKEQQSDWWVFFFFHSFKVSVCVSSTAATMWIRWRRPGLLERRGECVSLAEQLSTWTLNVPLSSEAP